MLANLEPWTHTQICTCVQHMRVCRALHHSDKRERGRTCGIEDLNASALQATPHIVGLIPSVPGHEVTGCQVNHQQQLLLESLTPRSLQLDIHDVLCERARRVGAQRVHSSLTSWTFARVVWNSLNRFRLHNFMFTEATETYSNFGPRPL